MNTVYVGQKLIVAVSLLVSWHMLDCHAFCDSQKPFWNSLVPILYAANLFDTVHVNRQGSYDHVQPSLACVILGDRLTVMLLILWIVAIHLCSWVSHEVSLLHKTYDTFLLVWALIKRLHMHFPPSWFFLSFICTWQNCAKCLAITYYLFI